MIHIQEEGHGTMEAEIGLNAPIRQKKSRISRHHQKLERGQKDSTLELSEGAWSCQQFEFKLLDYRSARESIFTVLRHPVKNFITQPVLGKYPWSGKEVILNQGLVQINVSELSQNCYYSQPQRWHKLLSPKQNVANDPG